jgi:hypothetical protein
MDRLLQNARMILEASCRARPGECVLVLVTSDAIAARAPALTAAALQLGLLPTTMDIRGFVASPAYRQGRILRPVKAAIEAADIVLNNIVHVHDSRRPDFSRLLDDPDIHDKTLDGERRWVYVQCAGMDEWDVDPQAVRRIAERTHWLLALLRSATQGRITAAPGTDLAFGLGPEATCTPILGIVPFYGEVAIAPFARATSGVFVVDGPTQLDVRPASETGRDPLRITVEAGRLVDARGDAEQLRRLRAFVASGNPSADTVDEVGIVTTTLAENDRWDWPDGTHHHDCAHVALGNNERRDVVVHGPRHMDGEIRRPTITIDGLLVVENGVFRDEAMT